MPKFQTIKMPLDLENLPKYCPQCRNNGIRSKVKKFPTKDDSRIIMCKSDQVHSTVHIGTQYSTHRYTVQYSQVHSTVHIGAH